MKYKLRITSTSPKFAAHACLYLFMVLFCNLSSGSGAYAYFAQGSNGCPTPPAPTGHAWYCDPVNGSMTTGDGSAAHPWATFSDVVSAGLISSQTRGGGPSITASTPLHLLNPKGVIKPGDVIYLKSGNHGSPGLNGYVNHSFITVMAAPGQTPVLTHLTPNGCANWAFIGISFQGLGGSVVRLNQSGWFGPTDHMYFANNTFCSQPDVSGWSIKDWQQNGAAGIILGGGSYCSVINNRFFNVKNAAGLFGSNILFQGNTINNFADDAIDYDANNLTIRWNTITNSVLIDDGIHSDGMQGQHGNGGPYNNILIDSNYIAAYTSPNLPLINNGQNGSNWGVEVGIQGIDNFGGATWSNVTVVNNVVLVVAWHGITFNGVKNLEIINNTVEELSLPQTPHTPYSWINTLTSVNAIVRNNVCESLLADAGTTADHNVIIKSGTPTDASKLFVNFNPPNGYPWDLRPLSPNSPLIGQGSTVDAPPVDVTGAPNKSPINVGAYAVGDRTIAPGSYTRSGSTNVSTINR